ncbi:MAG: hypothetical protein Q7S45_00235 [Candidatus Curtissbacteria bacterium]|nr:hypothetical protein [Candidatus Curtissbacteria bacterium]
MARVDSNRNLVAAIAYVPLISIFTSLAIFFVEKDDKYIRFHALQAILIYVCYLVISAVFSKLPLGSSLNGIIFLVFLAVWLFSMYKAWLGDIFKWPVIGDFAEKRIR